MYVSLPYLCGTRHGGRQPARTDLPHAGDNGWTPRSKRRGASPSRSLPRLPGVRIGLSLGRAIRPVNRALPRAHDEGGDPEQTVPAATPYAVPHDPVCPANALVGRFLPFSSAQPTRPPDGQARSAALAAVYISARSRDDAPLAAALWPLTRTVAR